MGPREWGGKMRNSPARPSLRGGFTLIELMIVVAILAIVATMAIPRMVSARAASQEASAISTLRSICSAQAQFLNTGLVDTNSNGAGEYGSLAELAGSAPLRIAIGGMPAAGVPGIDELRPASLSPLLGDVDANGVVLNQGYVFKIYLPGAAPAPVGLAEDPFGGFGGGSPFPDSSTAEYLWCAYAWPYEAGRTGRRAFFVNQNAEILASSNRGASGAPIYSGLLAAGHPPFQAAYTAFGMDALAAANGVGVDGNAWTMVQ